MTVTVFNPRTRKNRQIIREANLARDSKDYRRAADLYEQALRLVPDNAAIHIQCGHMFKEAEDLGDAEISLPPGKTACSGRSRPCFATRAFLQDRRTVKGSRALLQAGDRVETRLGGACPRIGRTVSCRLGHALRVGHGPQKIEIRELKTRRMMRMKRRDPSWITLLSTAHRRIGSAFTSIET